MGHPPWSRPVPAHIDRTVEVAAPCVCPHCQEATDQSQLGSTSYLQEDIVLRPRTIVTEWIHQTAWCPGCRRKVFTTLEGELPFAAIGPTAKAAALYLRHETKLPYRKLQKLMSDLFEEVFAFIRFGGPPTNNHAERALRPLVIFRKVSLGSRSRTGSENVTIFSSLAETTKLQEGKVIDLFQALFAGSTSQAHVQIFPDRS